MYHVRANLEKLRAQAAAMASPGSPSRVARLAHFSGFGSNPGDLDASLYIPDGATEGAPLVVVLHGCTQTAEGYDQSAAWSTVADEHGFILLFPEQKRVNNPNLCFNWFSPRDARRGRGECLSIVQMIEAVHERHHTDSKRVFVTGLSAGGAMTAALLATYPEIFAGGAIVAGLPFATANNVPQALERMRGQHMPEVSELARLLRSASGFAGPWPTISVWHGTNDLTVHSVNAKAIVDQWRDAHRVPERPTTIEKVGNHVRRIWTDETGRDVIEEYVVHGMGHGTPLSTLDPHSGEAAGPHMLEAGISSTRRLARFWRLDKGTTLNARADPAEGSSARSNPRGTVLEIVKHSDATRADAITRSIETALRAAGLMD